MFVEEEETPVEPVEEVKAEEEIETPTLDDAVQQIEDEGQRVLGDDKAV